MKVETSISHRNIGNLENPHCPNCFRGQRDILIIVQVKTVIAELDSFVLTSGFKMLSILLCKHHRLYRKALVPKVLVSEFGSFSISQSDRYVQTVN